MKTKLTLLFILLSLCCFAQKEDSLVRFPVDTITGNIIYSGILSFDTVYKNDIIFNEAMEWLSSNHKTFNRSNSEKNSQVGNSLFGVSKGNSAIVDALYKNDIPLTFKDPGTHKLIGRCVLKYSGSTMGCVRLLYVDFDIKIQTKNGKLKYEITNFNYSHYNFRTMQKEQIYGFTDSGNCKSSASLENLLNCKFCSSGLEKFYAFVDKNVKEVITDLSDYVKNNKPKGEW